MASQLDIDGELDEELGRDRRTRQAPKETGDSAPTNKLAALGINNRELAGLKDWVTKPVERNLPQGMVEVSVTHENLQQKILAVRFDLHATIGDVKARLYLHHGTPASSQRLVLRDGGIDLCPLDDDSKMLGFYSVQTGQTIHVFDTDPHSISRGGALENVDLVQKYKMSDDQYEKRKGTVREWIKEQRDADPNWKPPKPNNQGILSSLGGKPTSSSSSQQQKDVPSIDDVKDLYAVGDRCEIAPGARRGTVAYVGELDGASGAWIGVHLDEPLGKHNGSVKGKSYFDAPNLHGTFARPANVTVGDFPENDFDDDDEL